MHPDTLRGVRCPDRRTRQPRLTFLFITPAGTFSLRFLLRWLVSAVLGIVPCLADDPAATGTFQYDESEGAYRYAETITVEDRAPESAYSIDELPAFVTVIRIDEKSPRFLTVPEVLSRSAGVTVKDFGGLGKLSTVSIRGSSSNQVLVLLDGIRITDATGAGVDLSTLPLENIEKIEVLRGADSAVYGDGAMAGVVNLVTRKHGKTGRGFNGSLTAGAFNTWNSDVSYHVTGNRAKFRAQGFYRRSDGDFGFTNDSGTPDTPEDDFEAVRENNDLESGGGSVWLHFPDAGNWAVTQYADGYYADKGIPGMTTFPSFHARQTDRRVTNSWRFLRTIGAGETPDELSLELTGKWTGLDFDDPLGEQTGVPIHTRQRSGSYQSQLGYRYWLAGHSGSVSAQYHYETLDDREFEDPDRNTWSVSAKHDAPLLNDRLWITGIARYDHISDVDGRFSPKLGVKWFITGKLALKANAGGAFRSPSFNELYMNMGYITGNPDLLPETSKSYDLGVTWESPRFRSELAVFQTDAENLIQYVLVSGFRYKPFNIGKARSRGMEVDLACTLWRDINVSLAYTYLEALDCSGERNYDGRQIPGRPEHDGFARLEWDGRRFKCFCEWRYISGNFVTRANTKELPDRDTGNIGLQYELTENVILGAELKNVTDNSVVDVRGFPLPPRTFFANVRFLL